METQEAGSASKSSRITRCPSNIGRGHFLGVPRYNLLQFLFHVLSAVVVEQAEHRRRNGFFGF
jgi:hypothetical protein